MSFFSHETNFQGLKLGKYGINCLQTFRAKIWANAFSELSESYFGAIEKAIAKRGRDKSVEQFECLKKYCMAKTFDILSPDRLDHNVQVSLGYDVERWMSSPVGCTLDQFKLPAPERFAFTLTKTQ